jgi:hypothetical protein
MLGLIQCMTEAEPRQLALKSARSEFKLHKSESNPEKINQLVAKAESRISFLRMTVPRRGRNFGTSGHFVQTPDGDIVSYDAQMAAAASAFKDNRITEEQLERHNRLLRYAKDIISDIYTFILCLIFRISFRRQYFMDRSKPLRPESPAGKGYKVGPF